MDGTVSGFCSGYHPSLALNALCAYMRGHAAAVQKATKTRNYCAACTQSTTLEELYMSRTTLTGELPDSFSPDSQLRVWYAINKDPATGEIPGPGFSGTIPSSLSNAAHLAFVELSHHQLTGGVPQLPANIRMFESQSNALDGTIACEWQLPYQTATGSKNRLFTYLCRNCESSAGSSGMAFV
jgi:hypothetical protein